MRIPGAPTPANGHATNRETVNPGLPTYPTPTPCPATYNSPATPTATGRHLCSTQGWKEAGGTDLVGFRALPAGYYGWQFESVGKGSFFGTQDESTFMGPTTTMNIQLSPTTEMTGGASFGKSSKQSIRCVRN